MNSLLRILACALASLPAVASAADLSGYWWVHDGSGKIVIDAAQLPLRPAARKAYDANRVAAAKRQNLPIGAHDCLPDGPTRLMLKPFPFQILQRPEQVTILFERQHMVRFFYVGAAHQPDYYPLYMGDSIARWEGQTLVVESEGMNDQTVLDDSGLPHGEQLKLVERFSLADNGASLIVETTVSDPGFYSASWSYRTRYDRKLDVTLMDDVCTYGPPARAVSESIK